MSTSPLFEERPWGSYTVLEERAGYKVKRIEVLPAKRLSYQSHKSRAEHWFVVAGTAVVTLDGARIEVPTGAAVDIPLGAKHRVANEGAEQLVLIEVQRGDYLGEDDIERYDDDFGRV